MTKLKIFPSVLYLCLKKPLMLLFTFLAKNTISKAATKLKHTYLHLPNLFTCTLTDYQSVFANVL